MVFPTVDQRHFDAAALELLGQLLGDGKKSPLYKVIVEEKKLAPSVYAYSGTQEIAGTFEVVLTGFPTTDLTEAEDAMHEAFERFETDGFTTADLERLKAKYETGFYSGISSVLNKNLENTSDNAVGFCIASDALVLFLDIFLSELSKSLAMSSDTTLTELFFPSSF